MLQKDYTTKRREFKHLTKGKNANINITKIEYDKNANRKVNRNIAFNTLQGTLAWECLTNRYPSKKHKKYFLRCRSKSLWKNRENSKNTFKFAKVYDLLKYAENQILQNKLSSDAVCGRARLKNIFSEIVCTKTLCN